MIDPAANANGIAVVAIDGSGTPQVTLPNSTVTLTAGTTGCSFTTSAGDGVVVSPASVVMVSALEGTTNRYPVILFPEQTVPLSDLTGEWNRIGWQRTALNGPYQLDYGSVTLSAGIATAGYTCPVTADVSGGCTAMTPPAGTGLTVNSSGGYDGIAGGGMAGTRGFAYQNGGNTLLVLVDPDGSVDILTQQTPQAFPTSGITTASWGLQANTAGALVVGTGNAMPGISSTTVTFGTVDAANNIVPRTTNQDNAGAVSETLHYNVPLSGFLKRDGGARAAVFLPIPGMGVTVVSRLTDPTLTPAPAGFFNISVKQP